MPHLFSKSPGVCSLNAWSFERKCPEFLEKSPGLLEENTWTFEKQAEQAELSTKERQLQTAENRRGCPTFLSDSPKLVDKLMCQVKIRCNYSSKDSKNGTEEILAIRRPVATGFRCDRSNFELQQECNWRLSSSTCPIEGACQRPSRPCRISV